MMRPEELAEIKKRTEAASPGPWYLNHDLLVYGDGPYDYICELDAEKVDADFITHARNDVPKLLAEIERLRKVLEDFAKRGTRFDTMPTIGGIIQNACDVRGWYEYIDSMDASIRQRAKEALKCEN
jgi:hypothetical protein